MRKIILSMYMSLDGNISGPEGEFDWFVWDKEMEEYSIMLMNSIDTMLFGRITYQLMESYWPNASAPAENRIIIDGMNNTSKFVVSTTLKKADWSNTTLIKNNVAEEITKLKQKPGKDIVIYGSSALSASLTKYKLIDEYQIFVNPVVLGKGKRFLDGIDNKADLKLIGSRTFNCGNVLLIYNIRS